MSLASRVPQIDLSQPEAICGAQVRAACVDTGFFYVTNHGVNDALVAEAFAQYRQFFSLPEAQKRTILADENNRGWTPLSEETLDVPNQSEGDTKEGIYFGREVARDSPEAALPLHGPNQWPSPELLPAFRRVTEAYFGAVTQLATRLLRLLALALDLPPDHFASYFSKPMLYLRPLHYAPRKSDPERGVFGAGAHSDYGMLTLLQTDSNPGLQILAGGSFVDVPPVPGAFIVNLGDMLERWSNGRFKSTVHRVVTDGARDRYSIAFFFEPNFDAKVECLPSCCGPDNPPKYPPTTSGQYTLDRYAEAHAGYSSLPASATKAAGLVENGRA